MTKKIDKYHKLILDFLEKNNGGKNIRLREIAKHTELNHPQKVLNKIHQLEKLWYIKKNYEEGKYDIFRDNPIPEFTTIPIYSSDQFGKKWFTIPITEPIKKVKIPSDILWITGDADYFFIKMKWKDLWPAIKPNDLVLIKKEKKVIEWKKYLVVHNNKPKIKILQKIGKEKCLVSIDFNVDNEGPIMIEKDIKILWAPKKIITSI